MEATSEIKYLALRATEKLAAQGHEKAILKYFKKSRGLAERALDLALEIPAKQIKVSRGAAFFWYFKYLKNS